MKWRSLIGLLFNYIVAVHNALVEKVEPKLVDEIQKKLAVDFWAEQSQAFIDLFDLKQNDVRHAHALKRIFASLFDIKYEIISENEEEVVDVMEYSTCPYRVALEPIWSGICDACGFIGQIFINTLDPKIKHRVIVNGNVCRHITKRKAKT